MALGLTKLARLLLVALTLAGRRREPLAPATARYGHDDGRLELRFLGQQIIPTATQFQGTQFGGLSSFAYDKHRARLLRALRRSDERSLLHTAHRRLLGRSRRPDPRRDDACATRPVSRSRRSASTPKA